MKIIRRKSLLKLEPVERVRGRTRTKQLGKFNRRHSHRQSHRYDYMKESDARQEN